MPEFRQKIPRAYKIKVRARNLKGEEFELEAEGLLARVIQHELDHLDARLILDYASPIQRELYLRKRKKLLRRS